MFAESPRLRLASRDGPSIVDASPEWAWAAYRPSEKRPWTLALAGHLYPRELLEQVKAYLAEYRSTGSKP